MSFTRKMRHLALTCMAAGALLFGAVTPANAVKIDIYSDFSQNGGGAPFSNLVGSFFSPDVMFATNESYSWQPFGLFEFGAVISGTLNVAVDETYSFKLKSSDGSQLFIDGGLVVDLGDIHVPLSATGSVALTAGLHPFEIQFFTCCSGFSGIDLVLPKEGDVTFDNSNDVSVVPEPGTIALIGACIAGMPLVRRRNKRAAP